MNVNIYEWAINCFSIHLQDPLQDQKIKEGSGLFITLKYETKSLFCFQFFKDNVNKNKQP